MPITVQIIEGPLKGKEFELRSGMKIGRSSADINLKDPKVSSLHAEVRLSSGTITKLTLCDLDSTNGIKYKGKRVKNLDLTTGILFQVGNTTLKVTEVDIANEKIPAPELADWRAHLLRAVSKVKLPKGPPAEVRPFDPLVTLFFKEGPQKGEQLTLGYGPRIIGRLSPELVLNDPESKEASFTLIPISKGVLEFRTQNQDLVQFNGLSKESEKLKTGDKIKIGQTTIEIKIG